MEDDAHENTYYPSIYYSLGHSNIESDEDNGCKGSMDESNKDRVSYSDEYIEGDFLSDNEGNDESSSQSIHSNCPFHTPTLVEDDIPPIMSRDVHNRNSLSDDDSNKYLEVQHFPPYMYSLSDDDSNKYVEGQHFRPIMKSNHFRSNLEGRHSFLDDGNRGSAGGRGGKQTSGMLGNILVKTKKSGSNDEMWNSSLKDDPLAEEKREKRAEERRIREGKPPLKRKERGSIDSMFEVVVEGEDGKEGEDLGITRKNPFLGGSAGGNNPKFGNSLSEGKSAFLSGRGRSSFIRFIAGRSGERSGTRFFGAEKQDFFGNMFKGQENYEERYGKFEFTSRGPYHRVIIMKERKTKIDYKKNFLSYLKTDIFIKDNITSKTVIMRVLFGILLYIFYENYNRAHKEAMEKTYSWCAIQDFSTPCEGAADNPFDPDAYQSKQCNLTIEIRTVEGGQYFARNWFPQKRNSIYIEESKTELESDAFQCCPPDDCCGFRKERLTTTTPIPELSVQSQTEAGETRNGSNNMQGMQQVTPKTDVFCDAGDAFGVECNHAPWQCHFTLALNEGLLVTDLKYGRPDEGTLELILFWIFLILFLFQLRTWLRHVTIDIFLPWFWDLCIKEYIPTITIFLGWWFRFLLLKFFIIPILSFFDLMYWAFNEKPIIKREPWRRDEFGEKRHKRLQKIAYLKSLVKIKDDTVVIIEEEEKPTFEDLVEAVVLMKPKTPLDPKKLLRPLIKPLPRPADPAADYYWHNKIKMSDSLKKKLRFADAVDRDRTIYKANKNIHYKCGPAFSGTLKLSEMAERAACLEKNKEIALEIKRKKEEKEEALRKEKEEKEEREKEEEEKEKAQALLDEEIRKEEIRAEEDELFKPKTLAEIVLSSTNSEESEEESSETASEDERLSPEELRKKNERKARMRERVAVMKLKKKEEKRIRKIEEAERARLEAEERKKIEIEERKARLERLRQEKAERMELEKKKAEERRAKLDEIERLQMEGKNTNTEDLEAGDKGTDNDENLLKDAKVNNFSSPHHRGQGSILGDREPGDDKDLDLQWGQKLLPSLGILIKMKERARRAIREHRGIGHHVAGLSNLQREIIKRPFDVRDGPNLRQRARVDFLLEKENPPIDILERKRFKSFKDKQKHQYRGFQFQNSLPPDCTWFRFSPLWIQEEDQKRLKFGRDALPGVSYRAPLQEVRGNIIAVDREKMYPSPPLGKGAQAKKVSQTTSKVKRIEKMTYEKQLLKDNKGRIHPSDSPRRNSNDLTRMIDDGRSESKQSVHHTSDDSAEDEVTGPDGDIARALSQQQISNTEINRSLSKTSKTSKVSKDSKDDQDEKLRQEEEKMLALRKRTRSGAERHAKMLYAMKYLKKQRKYHSMGIDGQADSKSWAKLQNGYQLWLKKCRLLQGFDRLQAVEFDLLGDDPWLAKKKENKKAKQLRKQLHQLGMDKSLLGRDGRQNLQKDQSAFARAVHYGFDGIQGDGKDGDGMGGDFNTNEVDAVSRALRAGRRAPMVFVNNEPPKRPSLEGRLGRRETMEIDELDLVDEDQEIMYDKDDKPIISKTKQREEEYQQSIMNAFKRNFTDYEREVVDEETEKFNQKLKSNKQLASIFKDTKSVPPHIRKILERDLGRFTYANFTADKIGAIPHRVRHVPTTARLLVKQQYVSKDRPQGRLYNRPVVLRPPGERKSSRIAMDLPISPNGKKRLERIREANRERTRLKYDIDGDDITASRSRRMLRFSSSGSSGSFPMISGGTASAMEGPPPGLDASPEATLKYARRLSRHISVQLGPEITGSHFASSRNNLGSFASSRNLSSNRNIGSSGDDTMDSDDKDTQLKMPAHLQGISSDGNTNIDDTDTEGMSGQEGARKGGKVSFGNGATTGRGMFTKLKNKLSKVSRSKFAGTNKTAPKVSTTDSDGTDRGAKIKERIRSVIINVKPSTPRLKLPGKPKLFGKSKLLCKKGGNTTDDTADLLSQTSKDSRYSKNSKTS